MKIAVIGAGRVGGVLAKKFAAAGNDVFLGIREPASGKGKALEQLSAKISSWGIEEAVNKTDVVLFATPPDAAVALAKQIPRLRDKIIIDATNSVFKKPEPYRNAFEGIKKETGADHIVKCFNSTGFENMENTQYNDLRIDMFAAGSSIKAKETALLLSKQAGFQECYDFGGDDKVELLEQLAMCWINLAIIQKHGRNIAFKILKRD